MTNNANSASRFGRRRTLRIVGALAGVGLVASLGGTSALAQQSGGMPGVGATRPMGGAGQGGMMGGRTAMMEGMHGMMGMMMGGLMGPNADRIFIQEMIPHHQAAVAMATTAFGQAEHPEIKVLAEMIVRTQNWEIERMAAWHRDWFGTPVPPGKMAASGMHPSAMAGTKPADKAFLEMMSIHHQMAVMMASMALGAHQKPELATLQQTMISEQAKEIGQMRSWHRAWYPAG
ncbi:MAG: DUF305 domain-containing protein [Chloroflexota bacterium]|nr:MAG: DUF305 domain-containing protein [Chloroflexota bacterium]